MPRMTKPAKPKKLSSSIGGRPIMKIGSSGSTSNDSDSRDRIGSSIVAVNDGLCGVLMQQYIAGNRGEKERGRLQNYTAAMPERISARSSSISLRPLVVSTCQKVQPLQA